MPKRPSEDFDLSSLFVGPANIMTGMLGVADNFRKTVSGVSETIASLQRAARALELLVSRIDTIVTEVEAPMKVLVPEFEKAAKRLVRLGEVLEVPLERLVPGLEGAMSSLDRISSSALGESLEALKRQVVPLLDAFREIPRSFGLGALTDLMGLGGRASSERQKGTPVSDSSSKSVPVATPSRISPAKPPDPSKSSGAKRPAPKKDSAKKARPT